ncbi:hypothetical protein BDZ89DRAFT_1060643 [Hymenopellis radicata]|nr:hypothetical protein BDZ89DRAFT_1060643 [Hymenopellis radicata]
MSKVSSAPQAPPPPSAIYARDVKFLVVTDGSRRVLLPKKTLSNSFQEAVEIIASYYPSIPKERLVLHTDRLEECEGQPVEVTRESWPYVLPLVHTVSVSQLLNTPRDSLDDLIGRDLFDNSPPSYSNTLPGMATPRSPVISSNPPPAAHHNGAQAQDVKIEHSFSRRPPRSPPNNASRQPGMSTPRSPVIQSNHPSTSQRYPLCDARDNHRRDSEPNCNASSSRASSPGPRTPPLPMPPQSLPAKPLPPGPPELQYHIYISSPFTPEPKRCSVSEITDVAKLVESYAGIIGKKLNEFSLVYCGQTLMHGCLKDYNIGDGASLRCVLHDSRRSGGGGGERDPRRRLSS